MTEHRRHAGRTTRGGRNREVTGEQDKSMTQASKLMEPEQEPSERQGPAPALPRRWHTWLGVGVVVLLTAFLYAPARNHQFTNWDDDRQITANLDIRDLSPQGIGKIFSSVYLGLYQPLTTLGFAVEYRLFGLNPHVFHTVNILLHLVNVLLVFVLVRSLARNGEIALAAAALFAVHPLQVEATAWASSLSVVLCALFYLGTLIVYVAYVRSGRTRYYIGALALFVPALLAKTWAVTLPLVLLVIDFYLQRDYWRVLDAREDTENIGVAASRPKVLEMVHAWMAQLRRRFNWRIVGEKVPFLLLSFVFGCITMVARSAVTHFEGYALKWSLVQRLCIACSCCLWYVGKLIFPTDLSVLHPFPAPSNGGLPVVYYLAPVLLLGLAVAIGCAGRYRRLLAFTALFMLASLLLVVQIIPISDLMVCDRYAYIPCIGLFFLAGTLGYRMSAWGPSWRKAVLMGTAVVLALFSGATYRRVGVWRDSLTLWNDVIDRRQDISTAYLNRGVARANQGDHVAALVDFDKALQLDPNCEEALNSRGVSRMYLRDLPAALCDFDAAIRLSPDNSTYRVNRGLLKRDMGDPDGALCDFDAAVRLDARNTKALCERADLYWRKGNWPRVMADYEAALRLNPNHIYATLSLGAALVETGDCERAIALLNKGLALGYKGRQAYALLARAYQKTGRADLANEALRRAQELAHVGAPVQRPEGNEPP
jgi:tetratricopeptide (TPR) repeat protein